MISMRKKTRPLSEINVVPYIDVMLVLLVIFIITAPLMNQGVNVDLPQANTQNITITNQDVIIVSVDANGNNFLNVAEDPSVPLSPTDLVTRIAAQIAVDQQSKKDYMVLVKGDANATYGKIIQAMALLQQAGIQKVGLMTQQQDDVK